MPTRKRNPARQPRRRTSAELAEAAKTAARYYVEHHVPGFGRVIPLSPRRRLELRDEREVERQESVAKKRNEIDSRPWTGPTTQGAIAAKFRVTARTVRRWANNDTKGAVEVKKAGSMFYYRPWPD